MLKKSEKIEIKPNFSRQSGNGKNLIYLSIDKSYAILSFWKGKLRYDKYA